MNSRITFFNFMLVAFVIFEIYTVIQIWSPEDSLHKSVNSKAVKPEQFRTVKPFYVKNILPLSAYNDITKHNLFSVERKEYIPEVIAADPEPEVQQDPEAEIEELDTKKITLFGVIIMGDFKKALVSNLDGTSKSDSIWVEKGDTLDTFIVDFIEKDRLIVTNAGKKYSILLYDEKNPKERKFLQKSSGSKKKVIVPPPVKKLVPSKKDDEYEIITTPFGDFKRKKK